MDSISLPSVLGFDFGVGAVGTTCGGWAPAKLLRYVLDNRRTISPWTQGRTDWTSPSGGGDGVTRETRKRGVRGFHSRLLTAPGKHFLPFLPLRSDRPHLMLVVGSIKVDVMGEVGWCHLLFGPPVSLLRFGGDRPMGAEGGSFRRCAMLYGLPTSLLYLHAERKKRG